MRSCLSCAVVLGLVGLVVILAPVAYIVWQHFASLTGYPR